MADITEDYRQARRFKIPLNEASLKFSENYPTGLLEKVPILEIDAIIRRINNELQQMVRPTAKLMKKWCLGSLCLSVVVIGIFGIPYSVVLIHRFRNLISHYWERVRAYFLAINNSIYRSRRIEWRLVEDKQKIENRDLTNPILTFAIEVTCKDPPKIVQDKSNTHRFTVANQGFSLQNIFTDNDSEETSKTDSSLKEAADEFKNPLIPEISESSIDDQLSTDGAEYTSNSTINNALDEIATALPCSNSTSSNNHARKRSIIKVKEIESIAMIERLHNLTPMKVNFPNSSISYDDESSEESK